MGPKAAPKADQANRTLLKIVSGKLSVRTTASIAMHNMTTREASS